MKINQPLTNFYFFNRFFILLGLLLGISACQPLKSQADSDSAPKEVTGRSNTQLVLNNAILEQSNTQGNLQWKIKSEVTVYSDDRQNANLEVVTANLLLDGKIILKVKGDRGEVQENGNIIFLKGNVVAIDTRNQTIIQGDLAEWRPQENLLIVSQNFTGNHKNIRVKAENATYFTDVENLELLGKVAVDATNPFLRLKTDRLVWHIPEEKVLGNTPWRVIRYQGTIITDRLVADGGEWDIGGQAMTLKNNIELISLKPEVQIATDSAKWNYQKRTIISDRPIQIFDRQRQITITGNQGDMDLGKSIANLTKGVKGSRKINPAEFYANDLTWNIPTEIIEATGNVIYNQASPPAKLTGDRAIIKLQENNAVVSSDGNNQKRVISVFSDG